MGVTAGLAGLGMGIYGMTKGSPSSQVPTYALQNQAGADYGAYSGIQNLGNYNTYAQNLGQYGNVVQGMGQGNPYAGLYSQGAQTAGNLYQGAGLGAYGAGAQAYGAGGALSNAGLGQLGNVQALMNLGFDPQSALYNQTQQMNQQQQAAMMAQSGVATTPYGASLANQANTNFNIDWQNQQLNRAAQAAGAAGGLLGNIGGAAATGGNLAQLGAGLQGQGAGMFLQGAGTPYNVSQGISGDTLAALNQYGQFGAGAANQQNQQIMDYLNYLKQGNVNTNTQLTQAQQSFNETQKMAQGLGTGLSGLGNAWGGTSSPFAQSAAGQFGLPWGQQGPYSGFTGGYPSMSNPF